MLDYDRLAADYARHRQVHPEVLRDLATIGKVTGAATVLEVGCGTGNYLVALAARTGCAGQGLIRRRKCWPVRKRAPTTSRSWPAGPSSRLSRQHLRPRLHGGRDSPCR